MAQYKVLDNFAPEYEAHTYDVGDLVMYRGVLYKCIQFTASIGFDPSCFVQVSLKDIGTKSEPNPTITGNEAELLGLEVNGTVYQSQKLSNTDNISFSLGAPSDFTLANSYSSYNRMGKVVIFVTSVDIVKNNATSTPIFIGEYDNVPEEIFNKLVGGNYLVEEQTACYVDGVMGTIDVPSSLQKDIAGDNHFIMLEIDPTNMVVGTTYHLRHMSVFLLSDNIDEDAPQRILDNNSWATIRSVAVSGNTANYWAVGDTKTDLGTDGVTRTFRIVNIEVDGSIVFEEVGLEDDVIWNVTTNTDGDDAYNDYYISNMRNTHLPATLLKFSSGLQNVITTTNVKVATNGRSSSTLLTLTDKLFLAAEKEAWTSRLYSSQTEWDALTTFAYYVNHTSDADHVKRQYGDARSWALRSPRENSSASYCRVYSDGSQDYIGAANNVAISPFFRIGTAQTGGLGKPFSLCSWSEIDTIAKSGNAANFFAIGDTKKDTGTDGYTRRFRIVDMNSRGITLEQVGLEGTDGTGAYGVAWDSNNFNAWETSTMRVTTLPSVLTRYSSGLQAVITTTNVQTAENGNSTTLVITNDKLFLEAEKEVGLTSYSRAEEQAALTTYAYYVTHSQDSDRVKYKQASSAYDWWLRSPLSGYAHIVCGVNSGGGANFGNASNAVRFAPCFRIGIADILVSSTLNDNSWDVIKSVCEAGDAANYWSVGDTKTDTGTDGYTRTFRIADMSGLYGKHVVFEQVGLEGTDGTGTTGVKWDAGSDNDYSASDMNVTVLPSVVLRYSSELQQSLTNTTVKVAENGNSSTIVAAASKLFLEAEKEVGLTTYSRTEEQAVLTTYAYYVTHNQNSDRIKYDLSNATRVWWLRSPRSGYTYSVCIVLSDGGADYGNVNSSRRFAPCFSF